MDNCFSGAERVSEKTPVTEVDILNNNPVMVALLNIVNGSLAVLDENRKIVAINDTFLTLHGIAADTAPLGKSLGEALHCIHSHESTGCGSTKFCSTCGNDNAITATIRTDKPAEKICALKAERGGETVDIALLVRIQPIRIDDKKYVLFFSQDITRQQERAALERIFFHDVYNMINGLVGASEILTLQNGQSDLVNLIKQCAHRLKDEVDIQRCLLRNASLTYEPSWQKIYTSQVLEETHSFFTNHPVAKNKNLQFQTSYPIVPLKTDLSLLLRVLCNMVTNALEATKDNGIVIVSLEHTDSALSFCVWNETAISDDVALRIFQRNFSTKGDAGRGLGTYSMKLFGEKILGGQVDFRSSPNEGTEFKISLPI